MSVKYNRLYCHLSPKDEHFHLLVFKSDNTASIKSLPGLTTASSMVEAYPSHGRIVHTKSLDGIIQQVEKLVRDYSTDGCADASALDRFVKDAHYFMTLARRVYHQEAILQRAKLREIMVSILFRAFPATKSTHSLDQLLLRTKMTGGVDG